MKKPPLSQRLAVALLFEIASGNYQQEARFLSRREIMRRWKVSCLTVTEALRMLSNWDILQPNQRSGHYLLPQFLQNTLLHINKNSLPPLQGQPQWDNKVHALRHANRPLTRIAVVSTWHQPDTTLAKPHESLPTTTPLPIKIAAKVIFSEAKAAGVTVDFYADDGEPDTCKHIFKELSKARIQGVIILRRLLSTPVSPLATPLIKAGIPVVTVFDDCENLNMVSVNFNNVAIGYTATQQFLKLGHRHIAVAIAQEDESPFYYRDRYHGCELAAREHIAKHPGDSVRITPVSILLHTRKPPPLRVNALFDRANPERPTALLSTTVNILTELQPAFQSLRLKIPSDLSVIMCSSTPRLPKKKTDVDLMKLDFEEIGLQAFHALRASYSGEFTEKSWLVESHYEPHGTTLPLQASAVQRISRLYPCMTDEQRYA